MPLPSLILLLLAAILPLAACSPSAKSNQFAVAPGEYAAAFDATREVLRDYRFRLARIDAAAGVVGTEEKPSAGLATPWDIEQSTLGQEFEDLLNDQKRTVRITFEREGGGHPTADGPLTGSVWVTIYRTQTAGLRVPSKATSLTTMTTDPLLAAQGVQAIYDVPVSRDPALEKRLAAAITQRMAKPKPQTPETGSSQDAPPAEVHSTGPVAIVGVVTVIDGFSPR